MKRRTDKRRALRRNPGMRRRAFLQGAGGLAVSLPFLNYFRPGVARANGNRPCRFIVLNHRQGTLGFDWRPTGTETNFNFGQLLAPLEAHKQDLLVVAGIDNLAADLNVRLDGHQRAEKTLYSAEMTLENMSANGDPLPADQQTDTATAGGISIDQELASRISTQTPFRSIDLSIGNYGDAWIEQRTLEDTAFWSGPGQPVTSIIDPTLTFEYLFSDPSGGDSEAAARLLAQRLSVLDAVQDNFSHLRGRLGAEDRMRLDAHADKIRSIEQRLQNAPTCSSPSLELPPGYDFRLDDPVSARAQIDMLVLGMSCGMSNVGTLNFTDGHGPTFPWIEDPNPVVPPVPVGWSGDPAVDPPPAGYTEWHDMVHRGQPLVESDPLTAEPGLFAGFHFYSEIFAYLVETLRNTPAPEGGTMLESTCVLWLSEFGNGGRHWTYRLPTVLAGNVGPEVQMGRFVDFEPSQDWVGSGYNTSQLFTTILQAFGFDDPSFGKTGSFTVQGEGVSADIQGGRLPL